MPGCIKAWDTAWCATSAGMEVALLMALAILRLCGMVKEPIVAPSAKGPPREAACSTDSQSYPIAQGNTIVIGPALDVMHCPIYPICEHELLFQ